MSLNEVATPEEKQTVLGELGKIRAAVARAITHGDRLFVLLREVDRQISWLQRG
ncbi:MAG: hypothetical protein GTO02_20870 [Candidatus Dadabacteria bacterium]|nr:hypothetical protein [Candidatus Dadabacteria bacterium]